MSHPLAPLQSFEKLVALPSDTRTVRIHSVAMSVPRQPLMQLPKTPFITR